MPKKKKVKKVKKVKKLKKIKKVNIKNSTNLQLRLPRKKTISLGKMKNQRLKRLKNNLQKNVFII